MHFFFRIRDFFYIWEEKHLLQIECVCNNVNVVTATFDPFDASLPRQKVRKKISYSKLLNGIYKYDSMILWYWPWCKIELKLCFELIASYFSWSLVCQPTTTFHKSAWLSWYGQLVVGGPRWSTSMDHLETSYQSTNQLPPWDGFSNRWTITKNHVQNPWYHGIFWLCSFNRIQPHLYICFSGKRWPASVLQSFLLFYCECDVY